MATTPRPSLSQQQQHRGSSRFPPFSSHLTDTPTPLSSLHSNSVHSSSMLQGAEGGTKDSFNSNNNKQQQQQTTTNSHSRPLKPLSTITSRLSNISNNNNNSPHSSYSLGLGGVEAIEPDDTELERKEHELSFERMMKELQDARLSSSDDASSVVSSKRGFRDERDDEFTSEDDSEDDQDQEEDGSIRIGLSGIRYNSTRQREQEQEEEEHDSDELTYLTIPRSQLDPTSPAKPLLTSSSSRTNVFHSPVRRHHRLETETETKENQAPQTSATTNRTKPPFLSTFSPPTKSSLPAPRPPPPPQVQTNQNQYRSSPLNPLQNSPILATSTTNDTTTNHSRSRSISSTTNNPQVAAGGIRRQQDGGRPVTIEEVSDKGTPPRLSSSSQSQTRSPIVQPQSQTRWSVPRSGGGGGVRLPDMTFLTEALESPVKIIDRKPLASSTTLRSVNGTRPSSSSNGSTQKSKEAPLITGALSSLTSKLSQLEKENQTSSLRVQELESQLSRLQQQQQPQQPSSSSSSEEQRQRQQEKEKEIEKKVREEMFQLLKGERERRLELEFLVEQLREESQRQRQQQQFTTTRSVPPTIPSNSKQQQQQRQQQKQREREKEREVACSTALELKDEVKDLRFGLQSLGYEVEGVRTVVEGLLRDKEEQVYKGREETRWNLEEEERRKSLVEQGQGQGGVGRRRREEERGTDERPDTPRSENGSSISRMSFISAEDIERLRKEQEIEFSRRTPTRNSSSTSSSSSSLANQYQYRSREKGSKNIGRRRRRALSISSCYDSEQDSTYSPSSLHSSVSTSASTVSTTLTAPSLTELEEEEEEVEPDFERAEKIFKDVDRVERRERRERLKEEKEKQQQQQQGRKRGAMEDKSEELCKRCLGKKRSDETREKEKKEAASALQQEKERERQRERERIEREKEKERLRIEKAKAREKKRIQEREVHCRTLQAVLERLEDDFATQKKIYLELTVEYQSMNSRTSTKKRKALADHLKLSIDVLEEKAKEVKQYADALEDLYHSNLTKPTQHHHHH
ncbi:hypothetical protein JCM5350_006221 [Sporobolomyces pararoseus]